MAIEDIPGDIIAYVHTPSSTHMVGKGESVEHVHPEGVALILKLLPLHPFPECHLLHLLPGRTSQTNQAVSEMTTGKPPLIKNEMLQTPLT